MWNAKIEIQHDDWILSKTITHSVSAIGIPHTSYEKDGFWYHTGSVTLYGDALNIKNCISDIKKDSRVVKCEVENEHLFVLIKDNDAIAPKFSQEIFFLKPVTMINGIETWELGAWDKKTLIDFYEKISQTAHSKLAYVKQVKPQTFVGFSLPNITEKQKDIFLFAKQNGYYNIPKNITLAQLAHRKNISRATFQEHLKKAESKIMAKFEFTR